MLKTQPKNEKEYQKLKRLISFVYAFSKTKRHRFRERLDYLYSLTLNQNITKLINEKYKDYYVIFSRPGIGDILFIASRIKSFKQKHEGKVAFFTDKAHIADFLSKFPSVDSVEVIPQLNLLYYNRYIIQGHLQKGKFNILFSPYTGTKKTYTFSDNYSNCLDVPLDTELEFPVINENNFKNANAEFKKLGINPQKTIVIIPDSTMFDYRTITHEFWTDFANTLTNKGYDVIFNCKYDKYKGFKNTLLPIMDFAAMASQVKHIYTFRSGIADLFTALNITNMSVIYPPRFEVIWGDSLFLCGLHQHYEKKYDNMFDNIFYIHSLNSNFKRSDIDEIIYDHNEETLKNILLNRIK